MANEKEFSIELKADVAKGTYSNLSIVTHSPSEFVLDFAQVLPGLPKPEVVNRVIMTPEHAKRLLLALQENINKFESLNGSINIGEVKSVFPINGTTGTGTKS